MGIDDKSSDVGNFLKKSALVVAGIGVLFGSCQGYSWYSGKKFDESSAARLEDKLDKKNLNAAANDLDNIREKGRTIPPELVAEFENLYHEKYDEFVSEFNEFNASLEDYSCAAVGDLRKALGSLKSVHEKSYETGEVKDYDLYSDRLNYLGRMCKLNNSREYFWTLENIVSSEEDYPTTQEDFDVLVVKPVLEHFENGSKRNMGAINRQRDMEMGESRVKITEDLMMELYDFYNLHGDVLGLLEKIASDSELVFDDKTDLIKKMNARLEMAEHYRAEIRFNSLPSFETISRESFLGDSATLLEYKEDWAGNLLSDDVFDVELKEYTDLLVGHGLTLFEETLIRGANYEGLAIADGGYDAQLKIMGIEKEFADKVLSSLESHGDQKKFEVHRSKLYKFDLAQAVVTFLKHGRATEIAVDNNASADFVASIAHAREAIVKYEALPHYSRSLAKKMKKNVSRLSNDAKYLDFENCAASLDKAITKATTNSFDAKLVELVSRGYTYCKSLKAPSRGKSNLKKVYSQFTYDYAVHEVDAGIKELESKYVSYQKEWDLDPTDNEMKNGVNKYDAGEIIHEILPELREIEKITNKRLKRVASRSRSKYYAKKKELRQAMANCYAQLGRAVSTIASGSDGYAIDQVIATNILFKQAYKYDRSLKQEYLDVKTVLRGMERLSRR